MLKILFVTHSSTWGGAEKCLHLLLKALPRTEFEPIVLLPEEGALKDAIEDLGIETHIGPVLPWTHPGIDLWRGANFSEGVAEVSRLIESEQIDVVFSNTSVVAGGAFAARMSGIPHVWHVLEMLSSDPYLNPSLPYHEFYLLLDMLSDKIIAASGSVKAEIEKFVSPSNLEVIHTVVESADETEIERRKDVVFGLPEEAFVVCFVGDLSKRKGAEDLVRSAPAVLARNPNAQFMIAGRDAENAAAIRERITQEGLEDSIHLLGFRDDAKNIMAASDVFVLPTLSDPLPLVVQEAMSVGTPVVATLSGGCSDMVVDGETGYLVPVMDPEALADAIVSLMDSPESRTQMGEKGRQRFATQFRQQKYVDEITNVFTTLSDTDHSETVSLPMNNLINMLLPCLDACGDRHALTDMNKKLTESHDAIEQSRDAVEHAFSTQLGRSLTAPWRFLRSLVGK
jgi:glycosyltransferase involved in cell wall biosynthesis